MKILFVVGNIFPDSNANTNIVYTLEKELLSQGHQIDILGKTDVNCVQDKTNRYYYGIETLNQINAELPKIKDKVRKMTYWILHPKELHFRYCMKKDPQHVYKKYVEVCKEKIEFLCKCNKYDCVIAVSMPYWTSEALAKAQVRCKKVQYKLDPYVFNQLESSISHEERIRKEWFVLKNVEVSFLPKLDYKDMMNCSRFSEYRNKMHSVEFPNLTEHFEKDESNYVVIDKSKLSFIFLGYLYPDIRNPKNMLDMFVRLMNDIDFTVYMIGGGCEDMLNTYKNVLKDRLQIIKRVPSTEAYKIMRQADFLINIGNTVLNMVPSKIIDYISTGNSIINFVKSEECPTILYVKRYGNGISILDAEWEKSYSEIVAFILNKHLNIDYIDIVHEFKECTPQYVASFIIDRIS